MNQGMMGCNSYPLEHGLEFHSKGKDHHIRNHNHLNRLYNGNSQDFFHLSFKLNNIGKQDHSPCNYKINDKIPIICKMEHSDQYTYQQNMRNKKLPYPKLLSADFLYDCFPAADMFHPCIQNSHQQ